MTLLLPLTQIGQTVHNLGTPRIHRDDFFTLDLIKQRLMQTVVLLELFLTPFGRIAFILGIIYIKTLHNHAKQSPFFLWAGVSRSTLTLTIVQV